MLCPKCKNQIEDNAIVCEWCGASFANPNRGNPVTDNNLDRDLLNLLAKETDKNGKTKNLKTTRKIYQLTAHKNKWESIYYVKRLEFFRTHTSANETEWKVAWIRIKQNRKKTVIILAIAWVVSLIVAIIMVNVFDSRGWVGIIMVLINILFYGGIFMAILLFYDLHQYKKLGL